MQKTVKIVNSVVFENRPTHTHDLIGLELPLRERGLNWTGSLTMGFSKPMQGRVAYFPQESFFFVSEISSTASSDTMKRKGSEGLCRVWWQASM